MHAGVSIIRGGLRARGIIVQRQRVLESLHRVDPLSQILRKRITYRRQYRVPGLNSPWYNIHIYYHPLQLPPSPFIFFFCQPWGVNVLINLFIYEICIGY